MGKARRIAWRHSVKLAAGALFVMFLWTAPWRPAPLKASPPAQRATAPLRTVPEGTRVAANPGEKGDTYYWLEGRTTRLTTRFGDAKVVAERGPDGEIRARVHNGSGVEEGTLSARSSAVKYVPVDGEPLHALNDSGERPTLEWANRQAYTLWKSRHARAALGWQGGLMRPRGAPAVDLDREIVELQTDWADGVSMKSARKRQATLRFADDRKKDHTLAGEAVMGRLTKNGLEVGATAYFVQDKVFVWKLPGLTQGFIGPEHLADFGGWPFVPDAAWVNLQTIAFYHFKSLVDANGFVARKDGRCAPSRGPALAARLIDFFAPTVSANDPGCDGLHWLDGTMLRFCCDVHDVCYERYGCTYHSWWTIWSSWSCNACNAWTVWCFATGGCTCEAGFAWLQPADDRAARSAQVNT